MTRITQDTFNGRTLFVGDTVDHPRLGRCVIVGFTHRPIRAFGYERGVNIMSQDIRINNNATTRGTRGTANHLTVQARELTVFAQVCWAKYEVA